MEKTNPAKFKRSDLPTQYQHQWSDKAPDAEKCICGPYNKTPTERQWLNSVLSDAARACRSIIIAPMNDGVAVYRA